MAPGPQDHDVCECPLRMGAIRSLAEQERAGTSGENRAERNMGSRALLVRCCERACGALHCGRGGHRGLGQEPPPACALNEP
eukprot:4557850-Prymnesium_polylepis.2